MNGADLFLETCEEFEKIKNNNKLNNLIVTFLLSASNNHENRII